MKLDLNLLKKEVSDELINNILPFWMEKETDNEHGGFIGRISGEGIPLP